MEGITDQSDGAALEWIPSVGRLSAEDIAFRLMPAHRADGQALPRPKALYVDRRGEPMEMAELMASQTGRQIWSPIAHLRFMTPDYASGGAVALHSFEGQGAELLTFMTPGVVVTRGLLRFVFEWAFHEHDLLRLTVRVRSSDMRARRYASRLGFKHEGTLRNFFAIGDDAVMLGVLRSECRWLRSY